MAPLAIRSEILLTVLWAAGNSEQLPEDRNQN